MFSTCCVVTGGIEMDKMHREKLDSGGELVYGNRQMRIEYFFQGPDVRYGGVRIRIPGDEIAGYMNAWEENFARYEQLKSKDAAKMTVEKGLKGMLIRVGMMGGVYLSGNHMRISRRSELECIKKDYIHALGIMERMWKSDDC